MMKSWSGRKVSEEFNTTRHTASIAKKLVEEKGILSDPNPRKSRTIDEEVVNLVTAFYLSEDISRIMPGKKDFVSVVVNGERKHPSNVYWQAQVVHILFVFAQLIRT
jgi:hypothetical protein